MEPQPLTSSTPPVIPQPAVEQKPRHSNKNLKILLLVFLFFLLGVVAIYAFQNYQPQPQSGLLPRPEDIASPTPEETSEWNTYRNEKYGIEFEHPTEWGELIINDYSEENILAIKAADTNFDFSVSPKKQSIKDKDYIETIKETRAGSEFSTSGYADYEPKQTNKEQKSINGIDWVIYTFIFGNPRQLPYDRQAWGFALRDNEVISVVIRDKQNSTDDLVSKFLSTFRFVDISQALTKQCKNSSLAVSLRIPSDWTCESEQPQMAEKWITIKSDEFTINISSLGRGGPCGSGPDSENCKYELFFQNDRITLNNYFDSNKEGYEIFGTMPEGTWVSIEPTDKKMKEPTDEGSQLLKEVFATLTVLQ